MGYAGEHKGALISLLCRPIPSWRLALGIFAGATLVTPGEDPHAARDEAAWRQRYGCQAPPEFHTLVSACDWVERGAELPAWQARIEAKRAMPGAAAARISGAARAGAETVPGDEGAAERRGALRRPKGDDGSWHEKLWQ